MGLPETQDFDFLKKYLEVLVKEYPNPVTHAELAMKVGVTKSAITKVKDKLYGFCDTHSIVYRRKLVLKADETTGALLFSVFLPELGEFVDSNYSRELIKKYNIYPKLCEQLPDLPKFFDENDINRIIEVVLFNIGSFSIDDMGSRILDPEERSYFLSMKFSKALQNIFKDFKIPLKSEEDTKGLLTLRDKAFFLIMNQLSKWLEKLDIISSKNPRDKKLYLKVYMETADFYLKKLFKLWTDYIKTKAKATNIRFRQEYENIGYFFNKSE